MMQKTPPIVLNLIIINILVYIAQQIITPFNFTEWGSLHYFKSTLFMPHQFVTSIFMHNKASFSHLLFNMFALWMFGSVLENYLGSKWFLFFYLICGIGAGLFVQLTIPFSAGLIAKSAEGLAIATTYNLNISQTIEAIKQGYTANGASGAIMGIMAAFVYLFPNTKMIVFLIPEPIAAKYIIPFYILIDLFGGFQQIKGDNVGHFAHLGGALIGFLIILYWNKTNRKTFY
jgi:membrane associated rhomboid family serine protease